MKFFRYLLQSGERTLDFLLNFAAIFAGYSVIRLWSGGTWAMDSKLLIFESILVCFASVFLYSTYRVYEPMRTKPVFFFLGRILIINVAVAAGLSGLGLWLRGGQEELIRWISTAAILSTVVLSVKKMIMIVVLRGLRSNQKNIKYILVVTDSQEMVDLYLEELHRNPQFGYSVIGYIGNLNVVGLPHLGTTADLDHVIREFSPDEVVMAFDSVKKKIITKYISICDDNCVKVMFVPSVCGYFKAPRQISQVGNIPMVDIRSNPLDNISNQILKRVTDIVLSLLLLILTSPIMLLTAIGVKISSPGPVLFKQKRVGKDSKEFTMYKFRSMRVNPEQQTGWSTDDDDRKTKFGAFIRKFALDELPQFFNVLKGDMSLVGPRPEVPYYVEIFRKEIPLYMLKHTLRPGITGLAQIKGLRGDTSIRARIEEDLSYIENWTFWGDIRILLLTPFHAVNRHERYVRSEKREEQRQLAWQNRTYVQGQASQLSSLTLTDGEKQPDLKEAEKTPESALPEMPKTEGQALPKTQENQKSSEPKAPAKPKTENELVQQQKKTEQTPAVPVPPDGDQLTERFVISVETPAVPTEDFHPTDTVNSLGEKIEMQGAGHGKS